MIAPARLAAYDTLRAVGSGRIDLGSALARYRSRLTDERDRALAGEIATGALRWQAAADHLIAQFAKRPLKKLDPEIVDILRLSIFQLLHLDRIPASAAVKDAVDLAGKAGKRSASGLVNALLRRISRERDRLPLPPRPDDPSDRAAALAYLSITCSHPEWLAARWLDRYGFADAEAWVRFNNTPATLTLRVNSLKISRDDLSAALQREGIDVAPGPQAPEALLVRKGNPVVHPMREEGLFFVQDEASQLVGAFAGARPGERVLDACASPGGKTVQMATAMAGSGLVVAGDVRARRIAMLVDTVARSGTSNIRVIQADVTRPLPFGAVFDRILLDAPCSGLGTVRRDPDIKWRRQEQDLAVLSDAQVTMLQHVADVVGPAGRIVYSTCSSEPEENDEVVRRFLELRPEFAPVGEPLRTLPFRDGLEAFFAAMLVRRKDLR